MQFPINGQTYVHPSQATNNQRCVNMFLTGAGPDGKGKATLLPTPGLKLLINYGDEPCRGLYSVGNYIYTVIGNSVKKFSIDPYTKTVSSDTTLGTIGSTTGTVYFSNNKTQIILVDSSNNGYIITTATGVLTKITDVDFLGASNITYLDGYFIYGAPNSQQMFTSDIQDGMTWDPLDTASAEMRPDNLRGLGVTKGELWAFGEQTIEIWFDAANPTGFPLSARIGAGMDVGCAATGSIVSVDNILMWLDSRGYIVQSDVSPLFRDNNTGYSTKVVSTEAINNEIRSYIRLDDAIAMTFNDRGHIIYQITFPTANKTWAYDTSTDSWHEKTFHNTVTGEEEYHLAQYQTQYSNISLVGGIRNGRIYIMDHIYYDDANFPIHRTRVTSHNNYESKLVSIDCVEICLDCGYANQGTDPQITMRYSNNNGHTWSFSLPRSMGKVGEYNKKIRWNRLGTDTMWIFEFKIVEPIKFAIVDGYADITSVEDVINNG